MDEGISLEILLRLPVKSLLQFRSVCKQWRSIIDDPSFPHLHFLHSQTRPQAHRLLLCLPDAIDDKNNTWKFFSAGIDGGEASFLPLLTNPYKYHLLLSESAGGLVCAYTQGLFDYDTGGDVYVINPSIQECLLLPNPGANRDQDFSYRSYFALGFDPCTGTHKVFNFSNVFYCKERKWVCSVLTLGKDKSWRELDDKYPDGYLFRVPGSVFGNMAVVVNGALHFKGKESKNEDTFVVIAFDVEEEKFRVFPFPPSVSKRGDLLQVEGKLALIDYKKRQHGPYDLWVLEDYEKEVWILHHFEKSNRRRFFPTSEFVIGNKVEESGMMSIISYDMRRRRHRKVVIEKGHPQLRRLVYGKRDVTETSNRAFTNYVECLFSFSKFHHQFNTQA